MFTGRLSAKDFWKGFVPLVIITTVANSLITLLEVFPNWAALGPAGMFIAVSVLPFLIRMIFFAVLILIGGLFVRRIHDLGIAGWWVFGLLAASFLVDLFLSGTVAATIWNYLVLALWLPVSVWPSRPEGDNYGPLVIYRSWWIIILGNSEPIISPVQTA